jgi:hypothetical protein
MTRTAWFHTPRLGLAACFLALLCAGLARAQAPGGGPVVVEPADLTRRPDLVGKEVSVDDRVGRFQFHPGKGNDEVYLKRCPDVTFALPERLRDTPPQAPAVRIQGVLRREGDRFRVDVTAIDAMPSDLDRLNRAVATLLKSDIETRNAWARWAEARARAFQDEPLLARAREVAGDALRAESEKAPRDREAGTYYLGLAERARKEGIAEPEPSALAHRGFRAELTAAKTAPALTALAQKIEAFLPKAKDRSGPDAEAEIARWERPYANDPAGAYRAASPIARAVLDHRLWADAHQRRIERLAADDPKASLTLSEEAANLLPDRPTLATSLLEKGLAAESGNIGALRKSEVDNLARLCGERLKQPDRARELYKAWLDDQRTHRLSARDAEGRLSLAEQYESLLNDSPTAVSLLREAWTIDPQSRDTADAFRRRGFRKVGEDWVEPGRAPAASETSKPDHAPGMAGNDQPRPPAGDAGASSHLGMTPDQVQIQFGGKPNRRSLCATQGQITEQWVYVQARKNVYVTFVRKAGETHPRVTSYFSLPRAANDAPG